MSWKQLFRWIIATPRRFFTALGILILLLATGWGVRGLVWIRDQMGVPLQLCLLIALLGYACRRLFYSVSPEPKPTRKRRR